MPRRLAVLLLLSVPAGAVAGGPPSLPDGAAAPSDYVMAKLERHPVVILGEAHWIRHDAEFVAELVPRLAAAGVTLAMETLRASDQARLDALLAAPSWDGATALALQRSAAWPYREYLEIVRAAWRAGREARAAGRPAPRLLALGLDPDWRGRGLDYDGFMAERVLREAAARRRVLVYCGAHHAFTRYHQPELDLAGRATGFMDRMGNRLRRALGERVFLVTLHRPFWCGREPWDTCLPVAGAVDCAAVRLGRPVGFDVAGTPFGDLPVGADVYYAHGYVSLRLGEMTDGVVWSRPIERYEDVALIPLAELAPDDAALAEVAAANPFSDEPDADRERLEALWREEAARRADPLTHRRWRALLDWRAGCP